MPGFNGFLLDPVLSLLWEIIEQWLCISDVKQAGRGESITSRSQVITAPSERRFKGFRVNLEEETAQIESHPL